MKAKRVWLWFFVIAILFTLQSCAFVGMFFTTKLSVLEMIGAADKGDLAMVKVKLAEGVDPNAGIGNKGNVAALLVAAGKGHVEIVKVLLEHGADVNQGTTAEFMGDEGDNVYVGTTALIAAAFKGRTEVVQVLLDYGVNPNAGNANGSSPLGAATGMGHTKAAKALINAGADVNTKTTKFFVFRGDDVYVGTSPIIGAAFNGHLGCVKALLKGGADPNIENDKGVTPIFAASAQNHTKVSEAMIEAGADVNAQVKVAYIYQGNHTLVGNIPLTGPCYYGHYDEAKLLLEKGADPNLKNSVGLTPIFAAASKGHLKVCKLLIEKGADVNAKTTKKFIAVVDGPEIPPGITPLISAVASSSPEIVKLFIDNGAKDENDAALQFAKQKGESEMIAFLKVAK